jgi:hypothetical protein
MSTKDKKALQEILIIGEFINQNDSEDRRMEALDGRKSLKEIFYQYDNREMRLNKIRFFTSSGEIKSIMCNAVSSAGALC